jgi:hypothetical protein
MLADEQEALVEIDLQGRLLRRTPVSFRIDSIVSGGNVVLAVSWERQRSGLYAFRLDTMTPLPTFYPALDLSRCCIDSTRQLLCSFAGASVEMRALDRKLCTIALTTSVMCAFAPSGELLVFTATSNSMRRVLPEKESALSSLFPFVRYSSFPMCLAFAACGQYAYTVTIAADMSTTLQVWQ